MQGWALIINNLGRRRYPIYWWSPKQVFVRPEVLEHENDEETALRTLQEGPLRSAEDAGRTRETLLEARMQGEGAGGADFMQDPSGQNNIPMGAVESPEIGVPEPRLKPMTEGDRRRAEALINALSCSAFVESLTIRSAHSAIFSRNRLLFRLINYHFSSIYLFNNLNYKKFDRKKSTSRSIFLSIFV